MGGGVADGDGYIERDRGRRDSIEATAVSPLMIGPDGCAVGRWSESANIRREPTHYRVRNCFNGRISRRCSRIQGVFEVCRFDSPTSRPIFFPVVQ